MNDSHLAIYLAPSVVIPPRRLEGLMAIAGFQILHPSSKKVRLLDWEGNAREVGAEELPPDLSASAETSLQFWLSIVGEEHPDDVHCRVRRSAEAVVIELGDFSSGAVALSLATATWQWFQRYILDESDIALIVDLDGATLERAHWDHILLGSKLAVDCCDLVCARPAAAERVAAACSSHAQRTLLGRRVFVNESLRFILAPFPI